MSSCSSTHESMAFTCCSHDFVQSGEKQVSISSNKAKLLFSTWLEFLIYSLLCCFQSGWVDWATAAPSFYCFSAFDVHVVLVVWPNIWPNYTPGGLTFDSSWDTKVLMSDCKVPGSCACRSSPNHHLSTAVLHSWGVLSDILATKILHFGVICTKDIVSENLILQT